MELRAGYKETDVGVIPADWVVAPLGDLFDISAGGDFDPAVSSSFCDAVYPYPIFSNALTDAGLYGYTSSPIHRRGSVTVTARGMIGSANLRDTAFTAIGRVIVMHPKSIHDGRYFATFVNEKINFAVESTGVPQLTAPQISGYRTAVPPLPEQRAIATALSDADALIASLDALIAKKRDLQQAAMQQLLTGKTRLPGFTGEWEVKRLGDHVRFLKNGTLSRAQLSDDGMVKYLHYGDIHSAAALWLKPQGTEMPTADPELVKSLDRLEYGDVIYVDASEDLDGVGKSIEIQCCDGVEVVAGLHTIAARFDKRVLADGFKAYLQFVPTFRDHLRSMAAGTKVLATNRKHIAGAEVAIPSTSEQTAIAEVLSDMDAELAALEAQAAKARALKQGMIQELLTGRIRLA